MFYIQIDEVVLLRPHSRQHYPTYGPTYASFHPVDNMLASYNIDYKNETPTKGAGDHEKLLYRRVKKCLYQQTSWLVDKTKLHRNGGMEIPRLGGKMGRGGVKV